MLPIISLLFPNSQTGYCLVILIFMLIGAVNQVSNSSTVGLAGYFPSSFMSKQTIGTGIGGIIPNFLRIATLLFFPDSHDQVNMREIFLYYGASGIFLLFCIFVHFGFIKSDFAIMEINKSPNNYESSIANQESIIQSQLNSEEQLIKKKLKKME